MAYMLVWRKRN